MSGAFAIHHVIYGTNVNRKHLKFSLSRNESVKMAVIFGFAGREREGTELW